MVSERNDFTSFSFCITYLVDLDQKGLVHKIFFILIQKIDLELELLELHKVDGLEVLHYFGLVFKG